MKKIYAIQFKNKKFFSSDEKEICPVLYSSKKDAKDDLDWIELEYEPKIVEVKIEVK